MNQCNYYEIDFNQPYKNVDESGTVHFYERASNPNTMMLPPVKNGGIYRGPQSNKPWNPIYVTPTATNYINNNLNSANPPPTATIQYVSTNRLGNNYSATPGVKWYNPSFFIKGI